MYRECKNVLTAQSFENAKKKKGKSYIITLLSDNAHAYRFRYTDVSILIPTTFTRADVIRLSRRVQRLQSVCGGVEHTRETRLQTSPSLFRRVARSGREREARCTRSRSTSVRVHARVRDFYVRAAGGTSTLALCIVWWRGALDPSLLRAVVCSL